MRSFYFWWLKQIIVFGYIALKMDVVTENDLIFNLREVISDKSIFWPLQV